MDKNIEDTYRMIKPYLNEPAPHNSGRELLHAMCNNCERFCGVLEHDYSECREKPCFKLYLGYEYAEWCETWG